MKKGLLYVVLILVALTGCEKFNEEHSVLYGTWNIELADCMVDNIVANDSVDVILELSENMAYKVYVDSHFAESGRAEIREQTAGSLELCLKRKRDVASIPEYIRGFTHNTVFCGITDNNKVTLSNAASDGGYRSWELTRVE